MTACQVVTVMSWSTCADVPRAEQAADKEHPQGTKGRVTAGMTVLQQHIAYFDRNNDGIVYPWETFEGERRLSSATAPIIVWHCMHSCGYSSNGFVHWQAS